MMGSNQEKHAITMIAKGAWLLLWVLSIPCRAQCGSPPDNSRAEQLRHSREFTFEDLLRAKPEAVAIAKEFFCASTDPKLKMRVASILLYLHQAEEMHFDYLYKKAEAALSDPRPWPVILDKDGNVVSGAVNPEFVNYCKDHGLSQQDTFEAEKYQVPAPFMPIEAAEDERFYDLLIRGLHSKNLMIVELSALGLGKLRDAKAIDDLIATHGRVPVNSSTRNVIAEALVFIADPRAQKAAEEFVKDKQTLAFYRKEAEKRGYEY